MGRVAFRVLSSQNWGDVLVRLLPGGRAGEDPSLKQHTAPSPLPRHPTPVLLGSEHPSPWPVLSSPKLRGKRESLGLTLEAVTDLRQVSPSKAKFKALVLPAGNRERPCDQPPGQCTHRTERTRLPRVRRIASEFRQK